MAEAHQAWRAVGRWTVAVASALGVFVVLWWAWYAFGWPPQGAARLAVALPVAAVVSAALSGPLFAWAGHERSDRSGSALEGWLQTQIGSYKAAGWTDRPIDLTAYRKNEPPVPVRPTIEAWIDDRPGRVLVLTGNFGSGKTWTMRWLAQRLAERRLRGDRTAPIPVVIGLTQLSNCDPMTREQFFQRAWPAPLPDDALHAVHTNVLLLLDGLDELISLDGSDAQAKKILKFIAATEPPSTRFIVSCRTEAITSEPALGDLVALLSKTDSVDPTEWAVMKSVTSEYAGVEQIRILDVPQDLADSYLLHSPASNSWQKVRAEAAYLQLARVPFTIYLLQEALPRLSTSQTHATLPLLYSQAAESWLLRSGRSRQEVERALARLESLAVALLFEHEVGPVMEADEDLIRSGILVRLADNDYAFRHYSFAEYFLCCVVVKQMAQYSSSLLSRLDLIYANSLNRFLVPMLCAEFENALPSSGKTEVSCRLVSFRDFREFMTSTGWRKEGYGRWIRLQCADGTLPWDGPNAHRSERTVSNVLKEQETAASESPVAGASWYDAFQYCRWNGGRLPTHSEFISLGPLAGGCGSEWTSSWYNEPSGLIAVVRTNGDQRQRGIQAATAIHAEGINPDLRFRDLGFRVIY